MIKVRFHLYIMIKYILHYIGQHDVGHYIVSQVLTVVPNAEFIVFSNMNSEFLQHS